MTLYDNTHQGYSGKFVEVDGDIVREHSKYTDHWNIYQYVGMPLILAVEPDAKWTRYLDSQIVVEPSSFTFHNVTDTMDFGRENRNASIEHLNNIYIAGCQFARVSSDPEIINEVVQYFITGCESPTPNRTETVLFTALPIIPEDHAWYGYSQWIRDNLEDCRQKC